MRREVQGNGPQAARRRPGRGMCRQRAGDTGGHATLTRRARRTFSSYAALQDAMDKNKTKLDDGADGALDDDGPKPYGGVRNAGAEWMEELPADIDRYLGAEKALRACIRRVERGLAA